jgi:hypothetical protein
MIDFDFTQGPYSGMSTPRAEFPGILDYEGARGTFWQLPEHEILLGVDGEGSPMTADLNSDSPHVLVSAASGAGKSVTARSIATQGLIKGYTVVFLDAKRHSHRWAKNLPQVHYASSMPEIANALVSVAAEMHKRNEIVEEWPGDVESAPVGPRIMIVFEEMNATMDALADLDKQLGKGDYSSAAAFGDIMFLGRAARVHVLAIAQYADRNTIKTSIRENFGIRILIQHSWEAWNMLVPRASRSGGAPASPTAVGRGYAVVKGKPRETQFLYLGEELCAELVRNAYDARERAGLAPRWDRRDERRNRRRAIAATQRATGREV